jgi:hypothetical protein
MKPMMDAYNDFDYNVVTMIDVQMQQSMRLLAIDDEDCRSIESELLLIRHNVVAVANPYRRLRMRDFLAICVIYKN